MRLKRVLRVVLPLLIAVLLIVGFCINASIFDATVPHAQNGILNLSAWNQKHAFEITGEWAFFWDKTLTEAQIRNGKQDFVIVEAPGEWNYYKTKLGELPGMGRATYHLFVIGAEPGKEYGLRIQNMASAYRLYVDEALVAQNGTFGDTAAAPAFAYRPQFTTFTPQTDSFDLVLQVSNDAYAVGGMWEPVIFGTAQQIVDFNDVLSNLVLASCAGLVVMCLFFLIFYTAQRQEWDVLILSGIGVLVLLRLSINGDMYVTSFFPDMSVAGFGWIDYLTLLWIQFLIFYFVYWTYGNVVRKRQISALLFYSLFASLCVLLLPFYVVAGAYMVMNVILLLVLVFVTVLLVRAAWLGYPDASVLLGALSFILLLNVYNVFFEDHSLVYFCFDNSAADYTILFFAHCIIVARRYNRAQKIEMAFLRGQINPHFIHNSLAGIAGISRTDPARTRELLLNLSSYLRGYYDYDNRELIPLKEELSFVRAFVGIEQMRFGDHVKVVYEVESEDLLVPPLILQPLVENAFVHGLREKAEGGLVVVYARRAKSGRARIGVRDDGLGFGVKPSTLGRHGVGIKNINRRLLRIYRTQLIFTVPEGGGCEVFMEIPWKEAVLKNESVPD